MPQRVVCNRLGGVLNGETVESEANVKRRWQRHTGSLSVVFGLLALALAVAVALQRRMRASEAQRRQNGMKQIGDDKPS